MSFYKRSILTACEFNNVKFEDLIEKVGLNHLYDINSDYPWANLLEHELYLICTELNTARVFFEGYVSDEQLFNGDLTLDKYKEAAESNTLHEYFKSLGLKWWIENKTTEEIDNALFKISPSNLTRAKLNSAITFLNTGKDRYFNLDLLPEHEDVYINLVKTKPLYLKRIKFQTENIALAAVNCFAHAIEFVNTQTEKIASAAVTKNGLTLEFVEPQFHTEAIVKSAIRQNPLSFKFSSLKTESICFLAVEENGINYEFVPVELRTHELRLKALSSNGWAIKFIEEQTEEYALTAVLQNPETILYVDEAIRENNPLLKLIYSEIIKRHDFLSKCTN